MSLKLPKVDPVRLEAEWEADQDILRQLAANGDKARIKRPIDVSFLGDDERFEAVLKIASQFGFVELDRETDEEGDQYLFLECESAVDPESIKMLTRKCLQIEIMCDVEYDGWAARR